MDCPNCNEKASNNGRTETGIIKYICKNENCKFSFTENYGKKKIKYTKTEQRVINMLFNFLAAKPQRYLSLKEYFHEAETSKVNIKNPEFKVFKQNINKTLNFSEYGVHLLISVHNNKITLTKFCDPHIDKEHVLIMNDGKITVKSLKKRHYGVK